jgi:membrane protein
MSNRPARTQTKKRGSGINRPKQNSRDPKSASRGRGRKATEPTDIPPRGWKDIVLRIYANVGRDRVVALAAGVTYFSLLALFPAIGALVSLYGLFADVGTINHNLDMVAGILPGGALQVIGDEMTRVATQSDGKLGFAFASGLLLSLWSANAGIKALFDALNLVYAEKEKRNWFKLNLVSLTFTAGAIVMALAAMGAVVVVPVVFDFFGFHDSSELLVKLLRWPALFVLVALAVSFVYRYGPSRERAKWRWITPGSGLAAAVWLGISILFSWYAASFGSYNKTYGSLGAVMGFMVWIWLSSLVILLGAELDAEMEHQTAKDSTTGPPKPMGERGATMADTLGAAQD